MTDPLRIRDYQSTRSSGDKQVREIVDRLCKGDPVVNYGGRYVEVGGARFLRRHLETALAVYQDMRKRDREREMLRRKKEEERTDLLGRLARMVQGIFWGKK